MACQEGHEKIVKILIDNGADVPPEMLQKVVTCHHQCTDIYLYLFEAIVSQYQYIHFRRQQILGICHPLLENHTQMKAFHISGATIKHPHIVDIRRNDGALPLFIACAEGETDIVLHCFFLYLLYLLSHFYLLII
jgi:ankyrin repeat protein